MKQGPDRPGVVRRAAAAARESGAMLGSVFRNPNLRRVQLAFLGSTIGDWAYATAVTVWAYSEGGAAAVGLFQGARFIAMAVAAPVGAVVADKVSRRTFMMVADGVRAVLVVAAAACIMLDLPSMLVYALAMLCSVVGAPFRSAQAGLIPRLARSPDELTASNATASNLENIATFAGPALGAALVALTEVEVVFLLNAATFVCSLVLVAGIRVPATTGGREPVTQTSDTEPDAAPGAPPPSFLAELSAGFRVIAGTRDLRGVTVLAAAQGFAWGALTVFLVTMSVRYLGTGAAGIGYLNATMGVATIVGGAVVLARLRRKRVGQDMVVGVLGWALPLLAVAVWPSPVTVFAALAIVGLSDPMVNLGLDTIPQRVVPDSVLSRVFGALEAALVGAMALGAFAAPVLVERLGFRGALVAVGVLVTAVALAHAPRMRQLDRRLSAPDGLALVQATTLFSPLGPATQESLAHALQTVRVRAGEVVLAEGDDADGFFVIESGRVQVTQGCRVLRQEGPGEFFGEIGLLHAVPRTATVTALEDTVLRSLDRTSFLDAVTGNRAARRAAEEVAARRLAV